MINISNLTIDLEAMNSYCFCPEEYAVDFGLRIAVMLFIVATFMIFYFRTLRYKIKNEKHQRIMDLALLMANGMLAAVLLQVLWFLK